MECLREISTEVGKGLHMYIVCTCNNAHLIKTPPLIYLKHTTSLHTPVLPQVMLPIHLPTYLHPRRFSSHPFYMSINLISRPQILIFKPPSSQSAPNPPALMHRRYPRPYSMLGHHAHAMHHPPNLATGISAVHPPSVPGGSCILPPHIIHECACKKARSVLRRWSAASIENRYMLYVVIATCSFKEYFLL
jgi:hypothetical protein